MSKKTPTVSFSSPEGTSTPGADPTTDPVGGVEPEPSAGLPTAPPLQPIDEPFNPLKLMEKVENMVQKMDETDAKLYSVTSENQQLRIDASLAKQEADNHIILLQDQVDELSSREISPKEARRSSSYGGKIFKEPPP